MPAATSWSREAAPLSIEDDIAFLERVPALRLLGRTALRILAIGSESRNVNSGETLFSLGDRTDCGYVVQEGSFTLTAPTTPEEFVAGPGTLMGELALLVETKRPATAVAREPSVVIRISRSLFQKMLEGYPDAAVKLREQLNKSAAQAMSDMRDVRKLLDTSKAPD
jgi:CRP-like cAMP-binding protein